MWREDRLVLALGTLSGAIGYLAYMRSGILAGIAALLTSSLVLYSFSSGNRAWNTFSRLKNPLYTGMLFAVLGLAYITWKGLPPLSSTGFSLAAALLGAAVGMLAWKYWNIGS